MKWRSRERVLDLERESAVMGILNVTPDSFSDGGRYSSVDRALVHARAMIEEGAAIIDIGGESTRPGAPEVPEQEEIARVIPVIRALRQEWDGWISVDTWKASVAAEALAAGADVINDITGLTGDPEMPAICQRAGCAVVVMHMQGTPRTMQESPRYVNVVEEVKSFFQQRLDALVAAELSPDTLCFDPGIGFGKLHEHNLALLRSLDRLAPQDFPMLLGISRKSFIGRILGGDRPDQRDWPTIAITARAREAGVMLHRVHDVRRNLQALRMIEAILGC